MSNIWLTSDTHAFHKNIAGPGVSSWKSGYRDFKDQYEMTAKIADTFNKYCKHNDTIYHLGDWSFGGVDNILKFMDMLVCKNIHLIYGNHDENIKTNRKFEINGYHAQDLFTSCNDTLELNIGKQNKLFLSHYAHRVWLGSHKGVIHLYGHSHGSIPDYGKSMDVDVDVAFKLTKEWRPFHIDEIYKIMNNREVVFADHHSNKENIKQ